MERTSINKNRIVVLTIKQWEFIFYETTAWFGIKILRGSQGASYKHGKLYLNTAYNLRL